MASSVVLAIALVWFLLSGGVNGGWSLTKEEDEELDRQLRIINKPATVTIKVNKPPFLLFSPIFQVVFIYSFSADSLSISISCP